MLAIGREQEEVEDSGIQNTEDMLIQVLHSKHPSKERRGEPPIDHNE